MQEAGLTEIRKSIANRHNTVAQYIVTRTLLDLCEGARVREGARVPMRWWNQTGIDWETAKSKGGEETDSANGSGTKTDGEEERKEEREDASKASGSSGAERSGAERVQMSGSESQIDI